ncbi:hypothetical protein AGLY_014316 [Aphis glycines]|uniref:Uncharacterized protein n=1 Tax=Aphis glycines TaxID=307491 RepID=A0A6G0T4A6_APHGL|nr:hypothetical protein AGLY_014316 [Aphis glycines]
MCDVLRQLLHVWICISLDQNSSIKASLNSDFVKNLSDVDLFDCHKMSVLIFLCWSFVYYAPQHVSYYFDFYCRVLLLYQNLTIPFDFFFECLECFFTDCLPFRFLILKNLGVEVEFSSKSSPCRWAPIITIFSFNVFFTLRAYNKKNIKHNSVCLTHGVQRCDQMAGNGILLRYCRSPYTKIDGRRSGLSAASVTGLLLSLVLVGGRIAVELGPGPRCRWSASC